MLGLIPKLDVVPPQNVQNPTDPTAENNGAQTLRQRSSVSQNDDCLPLGDCRQWLLERRRRS